MQLTVKIPTTHMAGNRHLSACIAQSDIHCSVKSIMLCRLAYHGATIQSWFDRCIQICSGQGCLAGHSKQQQGCEQFNQYDHHPNKPIVLMFAVKAV